MELATYSIPKNKGRTCIQCGLVFTHKRPGSKACSSACSALIRKSYVRAWTAANPDKIRAASSKHRSTEAYRAKRRSERPKYADQDRAYRARPEAKVLIRNAGRRYDANNKEKRTAWKREWRRRNPETVAAIQAKHRALRRNAEGSFSKAEWKLLLWLFQYRCAYCLEIPEKLEPDHIIPVSRGGSNWIENIVPACRRCNASKGNRWVPQWS